MDILIRIILMIACSIFIPYIGCLLYSSLSEINFKELSRKEKIDLIPQAFLYIFLLNWFIIIPSYAFMECFNYIFDVF